MPMILLAVVGSSNQSNTIKMMSLFWWGALTNQIGNLKFEAYFEVLYLLLVVDTIRTLKVHHCLPVVTISCP